MLLEDCRPKEEQEKDKGFELIFLYHSEHTLMSTVPFSIIKLEYQDQDKVLSDDTEVKI